MQKKKTEDEVKTARKRPIKIVTRAAKKAARAKHVKRSFRELATTHAIAHFGGINAFGRAIDVPANTIQYWVDQGKFPEDHADLIIRAMKAHCHEIIRAACAGEVLSP